MENELNIIKRLKQNGHEAFFVGGAVRDILLNKTPNDIDIVTSASKEEIKSIFGNSKFVGESFGVSLVNGIEVATFRSDSKESDGRKPNKVKLGATKLEDAERRDLTINAMFLDPETNEIIDFFGGKEDLKNGIIKFVNDPEERIKEDNLRILRAVRFASSLGFNFKLSTRLALTKHANLIKNVSGERIVKEIKKSVKTKTFKEFIKLCDTIGLIGVIFPDVEALKDVEQDSRWHPEGDAFIHTMIVLENLNSDDFVLNMAALLHDIGKKETTEIIDGRIRAKGHEKESVKIAERVLNRLRLSNKEIEDIIFLIENHMKVKWFDDLKKSKKIRLVKDERFSKLVDLAFADSMTEESFERASEIEENSDKLINELEDFIEPLVDGRDLINLGLKPGKHFGKILADLYEIQLNEKISNKEELLSRRENG